MGIPLFAPSVVSFTFVGRQHSHPGTVAADKREVLSIDSRGMAIL